MTTKTEIKKAIVQALESPAHLNCYGGCARIYLEVSSALSIDDLFKLNKREQNTAERKHKKVAATAMEILETLGFKTIGSRVYIGYDNGTKIQYSKACAIKDGVKGLGIHFLVEAKED